MVALYAVWYNFVRIHKTLRVTPAMQAGVTDRLFSYEELVGIVDEWEANEKAEQMARNLSYAVFWSGTGGVRSGNSVGQKKSLSGSGFQVYPHQKRNGN
jgi:hypothetical protein